MKKQLLVALAAVLMVCQLQAQTDKLWSPHKGGNLVASKNVARPSFPTEFQLFRLNFDAMKQTLANAKDRFASRQGVIITLPNANGTLERFEVFEASNFEPELQAQFPDIRAYAGKGLDDKYAVLRMSISPQGIQTMVFRTGTKNEFMEPYTENGNVYAVYKSTRNEGYLPLSCQTEDQGIAADIKSKMSTLRSSTSELLTFRLALSCTGEYGAYFGGAAGALAQMNATMTRVNGVFEMDFTIHMSMIPNASIIYTNAATDPYSPAASMANWNLELQNTLTTNIGNAGYDIGHLFGASGGGGNAGCIGCVCVDPTVAVPEGKGSGITSPGSGAAMGDTFDIDYVAHEMGHQFGGNHTFSMSNEGSGVNVEPGSGSTIMGYAGITSQDVQPNSDAYFHYATIFQVEANMEGKTCPTRTPIANIAPVADAGSSYTIPKSTPFQLTGSATDANGNPLTYCWEQIDSGPGAAQDTGANSNARINKVNGPNFRSYLPVASPSRYFPRIQSVIANSVTTAGTEINVEALSSVARTLTFAMTARDNVAGMGLTSTDGIALTVNATAGPFTVNIPSNAALTYPVGTNLAVTWNVSGTTANNVNCANVDIFMSTDGGNTYPIVLATEVPNDGSETITIPNNVGTTNRIMIKGNNHVFFDISNNNFAITAPASSFSLAYSGTPANQNIPVCQGNTASYALQYTALAGFSGNTVFTATGAPAGTTVTFTPANTSVTAGVTMNITNTAAAALGNYTIVVTGTSGATTRTATVYLTVLSGSFGVQALTSPANLATGQSTTAILTWPANAAASMYDVQVASDVAFTTIVASGTVTGTTASVSGLAEGTNYWWRVMPKNAACNGTFSAAFKFTTGTSVCGNVYTNNTVVAIADGTGANVAGPVASKTVVVPAGNPVNDVNVSLAFTHTYIEDLVIWIEHPDGTRVDLWNRNCDEEFDDVNVTFSDGNPFIPTGGCTVSTGTWSPDSPLSAFNGKASGGTWTLKATDNYNGDTGSLLNWSIELCTAQPLGVDENSFQDFALFPNPNNGSFTVKLTSASGNDIKVNVHDLRGRSIFEKSYSNTGTFNQNINLDKVQTGVYLVSVEDGAKKTVRRIVIQ